MALAEARAAWQRTANRCLVQEDAKRAPKLACCSSVSPSIKQNDTELTSAADGQEIPPSVKQNDTELTSAADGQEIPSTGSLPFNRNTSYSNLSPNSRWWLQLQPTYGYQKGLMDDHFNSSQGADMETCQMCDCPNILARTEDNFGMTDQHTHVKDSLSNNQCRFFATCENKDLIVKEEELRAVCSKNYQDPLMFEVKEVVKEVRDEGLAGCGVFKNANEHYFHSVSSWNGTEKNTPWWRTADTEELALLVAQRSHDLLQNCDLPSPQNARVKMDLDVYTCGFSHDGFSASSLDPNSDAGGHHHLTAHKYKPGSLTAGSACQKLRMSTEGQLVSSDKPLWHNPTHEGLSKMHIFENGTRNAQLLEALRHSQTRAREADKVAKQALSEKQHVLKLVLRQASQLFAYKQWLQLLQLENMYFQFKSNKSHPASTAFPVTVPWIPQRTRKMRKSKKKSASRKRANQSCLPRFDVNKYAVVFALGLGLVSAGLFLGWTIGWLLPTW